MKFINSLKKGKSLTKREQKRQISDRKKCEPKTKLMSKSFHEVLEVLRPIHTEKQNHAKCPEMPTKSRINALKITQYKLTKLSNTKSLTQSRRYAPLTQAKTRQKAALQSAIRKKRNKLRIRKNAATSRIRSATYCDLENLGLTH